MFTYYLIKVAWGGDARIAKYYVARLPKYMRSSFTKALIYVPNFINLTEQFA